MNNLEIIDKKIEILEEELRKIEATFWDIHIMSFEDFIKDLDNKARPTRLKLGKLSRARRLIISPVMEEMSDYGDLMTIHEFENHCKCGGFIDYDGFGRYATETKESNIEIYPSDVKHKSVRKDFSHVIWFNR